MNFRTKIFLSLLLVSIVFSTLTLIGTYFVVKKYAKNEFVSRYNSLGYVVANMFHQMGKVSDQVNKNAVEILRKIDKLSGIPSDKKLAILAKNLGIQGFYVINKSGKFIRSSDLPLRMQKNSLFSYCAGYKNLVDGHLNKAVTPIIPSYPYGIPSKFIMVPNFNRSLILETGIHLSYISNILHKSVEYNKNIISIGLFSPNGYKLGFISSSGKFMQGSNKVPISTLFGDYKKNNTMVLNFKIPASVTYCCECHYKGVQNITPGAYYYTLQMTTSLSPLINALFKIKMYFLFLFFVMLIVSFIISKFLANKLVVRIHTMSKVINEIMHTGDLNRSVLIGNNIDEIGKLADNFNKMIVNLKSFQESAIEYESEKAKSIEHISKQVAHDIRSPLSSLEIIIKKLPEIEESKYILLRDAVSHIRDIANNLEKNSVNEKNSKHRSLTQIAVLLDYVISERRTAFSDDIVEMIYDFTPESYGYFVDASPSEMRRILTNVINNAREALPPAGNKITITIEQKNNNVTITISDNGAGISPPTLSLLFKRGFTTKGLGSGLGLSHARENLQQWGGSINLIPNADRGVSVFITLPLQTPPSWFTDQLMVPNNSSVICVDDSISIFHGWRERFKSIPNTKINLFYCGSKEMLLPEIEKHRDDLCTYLVDYEFSEKNYNGLDLIKIILAHKNSQSTIFLVTSRSTENDIQIFCAKNGIKMIPKNFVCKIAIIVE